MSRVSSLEFFGLLKWLDGAPLLERIEPYRRLLFTAALDVRDVIEGGATRPQRNLVVVGRAKKNWKSADLILAALYCLTANDSAGGNQCYLFGNDEEQAGDDLALAKKLVEANPLLGDLLVFKQKAIERRDAKGFLLILPAQDAVGTHGKTYRFCGFDEIHGYRDWDLLEAMQHDPTRLDALMWITSYASLFHKPGVPLYDLTLRGRAGDDPRLLFSWYAADVCTDPDFAAADPETRANPSRGTWADSDYLAQQQRRLPAHKFRRLHLNLPGLPAGSAFQVEPVLAAIDRGVGQRAPGPGVEYVAFVDMSGGSNDDAVLAIAHKDPEGDAVLDLLMNQGPPPPFDPRLAVGRFQAALFLYGVRRVTGDNYAGETFKADFARYGVEYEVSELTRSQLYEALEPVLNAGEVRLLDVPTLEQQLLGLVWRGHKIDHPAGEHDDWANAAAGALQACLVAQEELKTW